jgi:polyisoprenyl-teichoic acid--peptidoglycan teichoic acid transferase
MTFDIRPGQQHIDGKTALMYARSRHTTSDYARSARQQDIIKAILNQAFKSENITSISTIKKIYNEYKEMVTTNIQMDELI